MTREIVGWACAGVLGLAVTLAGLIALMCFGCALRDGDEDAWAVLWLLLLITLIGGAAWGFSA